MLDFYDVYVDAAVSTVKVCDDAYSAAVGAHALVILTEWDEFKGLPLFLATPVPQHTIPPPCLRSHAILTSSARLPAHLRQHAQARLSVRRAADPGPRAPQGYWLPRGGYWQDAVSLGTGTPLFWTHTHYILIFKLLQ